MKCTKCGKELKEGQLYCEECGAEIQIVPVFEPEFEHEINETLTGVAEEVVEHTDSQLEKKQLADTKRKGKRIRKMSIPVIGIFILFLFVIQIFIYRNNSFEYQVQQAAKAAKIKNYTNAVQNMKKALSIDGGTADDVVLLADYYMKANQTENAIIILKDCIENYEEVEEAYRKLIKIYESDKQYEEISDLLLSCKDTEIITQFQSFTAFPPEFSLKDRVYNEVVPLKLSANTTGKIYYTMDGTVPTKSSTEYTAPVFLEPGTYDINAIFINNYGIISECAKKSYVIQVTIPKKPEVSPYSGFYKTPQMIEVKNADIGTTYYTVDGTIPTKDSSAYINPISMPLGTSSFKFVTYGDDGAVSDVTERIFEFKLSAAKFSAQDAIAITIRFLLDNQYLLDAAGTAPDGLGKYIYTCNTAVLVNNVSYYLITESYVDALAVQTRTGNLLAINIVTGEINRAEVDIKGNITVSAY